MASPRRAWPPVAVPACSAVYAAEAGSSPAARWPPSSPVIWLLLAGIVVMFMHVGFAIVETGFCRAKNALNTTAITLMVFPLGSLAFWSYGFAVGWGNLPSAVVPALAGLPERRRQPSRLREQPRSRGEPRWRSQILRSIADWVSAC